MRTTCVACGAEFTATKPARFCSDRCRKRVARGTVVPLDRRRPRPPQESPGRLQEATRAHLEAAGVESTPFGVAAVLLAADLESPETPAAVKATVSKAFRETLAAATTGARRGSSVDELRDELARRRARQH